jgi:hypothetical protein
LLDVVLPLQDRPEHGISKESYMQAVLEGLKQYKAAAAAATAAAAAAAAAVAPMQTGSSDILVKFLLSIDRRNDTAAALGTVRRNSCNRLFFGWPICGPQAFQIACFHVLWPRFRVVIFCYYPSMHATEPQQTLLSAMLCLVLQSAVQKRGSKHAHHLPHLTDTTQFLAMHAAGTAGYQTGRPGCGRG